MSLPLIGLLEGIGPASTRLDYDQLVRRGRARFGTTPEMLVYCLDFDRFTALEEETDRTGYVREIRRGLAMLVTTDKEALEAVHAFLRFQITDHQTGDSLEVKIRPGIGGD